MYTRYFGFRNKPFNLTPDPRFFYETPVYREAYASLLYGIRERKGFAVLTGEVGTGKTMLLRRLMDQRGVSFRFAFLYNTSLSYDELLSFMCDEFRLSVGEKSRVQKIQALNEFLIGQLRERSAAVLLIDEAQNLGKDTLENLRLLSNLETANHKLLQIVLAGQPELLHRLDDPELRQVKQRVAVWIRLSSLKEKEVGDFIRHRLQTVGYAGRELFTAPAVRQIVLVTQGIPRLVNIVCDNALLIAYAKSQKKVSPEMIHEVASDLRLGPGVPYEIGDGAGTDWMLGDNGKGRGDSPAVARRRSRAGRWADLGTGAFLGMALVSVLWFFISPLEIQAVIPNLSVKAGETLGAVRDTIQTLQTTFALGSDGKKEGAGWPGEAILALESEVPDETPREPVKPAEVPPRNEEQPLDQVPHARGAKSANGEPVDLAVVKPRPEDEPEGDPRSNWAEQPIVVQRGMSIGQLVRKVYGGENTLAIDLADEFNPHINDLNRLRAGDRLWLPPLTRETLFRRQSNGTYQLILASFRSSLAADRFAQRVGRSGYVVEIKPKKVFGERSLHRVQIVGLRDLRAAERAWRVARSQRWLEWDGRPASESASRSAKR